VSFNDVVVPSEYLIGEEGQGFLALMVNFQHERFLICIGACRAARLCYEVG
jgi:acyl-CoA dehydrogenase